MRIRLLSLAGIMMIAAGCGDEATPTDASQAVRTSSAELSRSGLAEEVGSDALFEFETLAGNQGPFVGAAGAIRGVDAGGLPWVLAKGEARLDADGELRVEVEGLVLDPDDPRVPSHLRGINPAPAFGATLSCLSFDETGARVTVNLRTATVPTDRAGDAKIREQLTGIPDPCYAPVVFVTSPGGSWFAVSGF